MYKGIIIEESLENKEVLKKLRIISTDIEKVTQKHNTPWIGQWTMHTVEIPEIDSKKIADEISRSLDKKHANAWYADLKNDEYHYLIFKGHVFYIDRQQPEEYEVAKKYGMLLGIPEHQLDFS